MRAIERILKNEEFQKIYSGLNAQDAHRVRSIIEREDKDALAEWFKNQKKVESQTIRVLRAKARTLAIPYWFNLDKQLLLSEIHNASVQDSHR